VTQIAEASGWASHTVRGFLTGLKKKGFEVRALERVRIVGPGKERSTNSYTVYTIAVRGFGGHQTRHVAPRLDQPLVRYLATQAFQRSVSSSSRSTQNSFASSEPPNSPVARLGPAGRFAITSADSSGVAAFTVGP
jgi:hypothetical protein